MVCKTCHFYCPGGDFRLHSMMTWGSFGEIGSRWVYSSRVRVTGTSGTYNISGWGPTPGSHYVFYIFGSSCFDYGLFCFCFFFLLEERDLSLSLTEMIEHFAFKTFSSAISNFVYEHWIVAHYARAVGSQYDLARRKIQSRTYRGLLCRCLSELKASRTAMQLASIKIHRGQDRDLVPT